MRAAASRSASRGKRRSTTSYAPISRTCWGERSLSSSGKPALAPEAPGLTLLAMTYVDAAVAPLRKTGQIKIHGPAPFEAMRKAGQLVARCLDMLVEHVQPGVPTEKIDKLVLEYALDHGALPATLMYRGYKKSTCTSLNHVVCHGIPGDKPLKEGDIVNIDVTLILDGGHGDSSRMYAIGEIPRRAERLIE